MRWLLALLLLTGGALAQSSQPPDAPKYEQSANKTEAHRTEYNPFVRFWMWTSHDPIAFYTFVLAIFTGVLGATAIVQIRYLRKADETARVAADAANLSARAAIGVELPIIRSIRYPGFIRREKPEEMGRGGVFIETTIGQFSEFTGVRFQNVGRTPAYPIKYEVGWTTNKSLDVDPQYLVSVPCDPSAVIRDSEGVFDPPALPTLIELTVEEQAATNERKSPIWVYISLHYIDFLNLPHEARFCWTLLGKGGTPPPAYTQRT